MSKVLFVDACARGWEVSRTYAVAEAFMNAYREQHPRDEIEELTLAGLGLAYFTGKELEYRDALLARGGQADDYFKLARQFAAADKIVIAAPYWDLSFPALLKVYIERVSVSGITFSPEPDGRLRGLCRGEKMLLITTSGGDFTHEDLSLYGTALSYLRGICAMFGVDGFDYLWTHGLDIVGNDPEAILRGAKKQAAAFAERAGKGGFSDRKGPQSP